MSTYTELGASMAARAFFYPSLLFNIARERLQEDWHWCDLITEVRRSQLFLHSHAHSTLLAGAACSGAGCWLSGLGEDPFLMPPCLLQNVMLGAIPFPSMLDVEFQQLVGCCTSHHAG
jgi:hypothetical protein